MSAGTGLGAAHWTGAADKRPTWEFAASVALHAAVVGAVLLLGGGDADDRPLIDPHDVMIVSAVALPKQTGRMPDKPMRTPTPPQGEAPVTAPPPPQASDMALHTPEAPKPEGRPEPPDHSVDREALLNAARRQALVDAAAPIGPENHTRTAPDGVDPADAILGSGGAGIHDPELARWKAAVEAAIRRNWTPLPATVAAHPEYVVYVVVPIDAEGRLGTPQIYQGTGDASFDRSALLAVMKTRRVAAPPEKWRSSTEVGVVLEFPAKASQ
ncbi:MAG: TonB family protein [Deltaproteobacteria bacterium]|nr:MAG: TonB family protein [Deltaproteobacteria bacterium]